MSVLAFAANVAANNYDSTNIFARILNYSLLVVLNDFMFACFFLFL